MNANTQFLASIDYILDDDETHYEVESFIRNLIEAYAKKRHTSIKYLLFSGKFNSRYDSMFSGEGSTFLLYENVKNNILTCLFDRISSQIEQYTLRVDDGLLHIEANDHDGTFELDLSIISSSKAEKYGLTTLDMSSERRKELADIITNSLSNGATYFSQSCVDSVQTLLD